MRVIQRGLPPGVALEVNVVNTRTGEELGEVDVVSSSAGTIDVRLPAPLRGVQQVVVEVERRSDDTEMGEVGADLPQPCATTPRPLHPLTASSATSTATAQAAVPVGPVARPSVGASPGPSSAIDRAGGGPSWLLIPLVLVGGVLAVVLGLLVGRSSRRPD